jgi:hypothetical protein
LGHRNQGDFVSRRRSALLLALSALLLVLSALLLPAGPASAQVQDSATLTVLRGQVAVLRPDGSAIQPAPSGTIIRAGDEIRTLPTTGALVTFFVGTEIEMGADTILVVESVARQGERVNVSLKQVFGMTLNRVQALADPGSAYRIEAGGAVAVVRGTTFLLLGPTPEGIVVLACLDDCDRRTTFAGVPLAPFIGYYAQVERGRVVRGPTAFRPDRDAGYWNAASEAVTSALQDLQGDTRGVPAGQVPAGQEQEIRDAGRDADREDDREDGPPTDEVPDPGTVPPSPPSGPPSPHQQLPCDFLPTGCGG